MKELFKEFIDQNPDLVLYANFLFSLPIKREVYVPVTLGELFADDRRFNKLLNDPWPETSYYSKRFTRVTGYYKYNKIFINLRKRKRGLINYKTFETYFHELLHHVGFKHKGNFLNSFNHETVPYRLAKEFSLFLLNKGKLIK